MVLSLSFALLCTFICFYYALFSPWFGSPLRAWLAMCLSGVSFEFSLHSRVALSPAHPPLIFLFFLGFLGEASACKAFTKRWVTHLMWFLYLLFWSIVLSCVVACLPLAPGVLGFANLRSFGCCPLAYFRVPAACGSPVPSYFLTPLFHVIYAVHCCTLRYASANRGGISGACHTVITHISHNGTVSHT